MSTANFVQETTTSIAGTSGNGDVTLSAISGSPRFSSVFGTAKRVVDYVIAQASTGKLERGYGYVSNNVLTRTKVKETWDGTSFLPVPGSATSATALQFGSAPSSGDVVVRLAPLADGFAPIVPYLQTAVGPATDHFRYTAHVTQAASTGSANPFGTTNENYILYKNIARGVLSGVEVTLKAAGAAGAVVKAAIYEVGPDGLPGQCITQFNSISAMSTGTKQDTTPSTWSVPGPIPLPPGWYYLGFVCNDAAVAMDCWNGTFISDMPPLGRYDGYGHAVAITKTQEVANALPAGIPTGTYTIYGQSGTRHFAPRLKVVQP